MAKKTKKEKIEKSNIEKIDIEKIDIMEKQEEIKKYKAKIYNVEDKAVLVNFLNTPKRIYFDLTFKELEYYKENKNSYKNKTLNIYYIGDITDKKTIKILPIKSLEDIGDRF
jgi:hypothetical protein